MNFPIVVSSRKPSTHWRGGSGWPRGHPGARDPPQPGADRALAVARDFGQIDAPAGSSIAVTAVMLRVVAADIMVFAGVDASEADAALRAGQADIEGPRPP